MDLTRDNKKLICDYTLLIEINFNFKFLRILDMLKNKTLPIVLLSIATALIGCKGPDKYTASAETSSTNTIEAKQAVANQIKTETFFAASFKDFDRKSQPLNQYQGKTIVTYFWATWCKSCVAEVPMLKALQEKYIDKNVVLVGIAVDNTDKVKQFVKDHDITYPMLIGGDDALALSKDLGNLVTGLPFMVMIDKNGKFSAKFLGELKQEKLESKLNAII